jgi:hypothetical protein
MTGAYFRVNRYGKWESIELEHLTESERANLLKDKDPEFLLSCLDLTCRKLRENEQMFDELVQDGILETA